MDERVSVNITTYNRSNALNRCLESVLNQSYKNLEVIVVDDHSTDGTEDVVKKHMDADSRLSYIRHQTNKGNASARNTALKKCTGHYVAFMDDDDEWIDKQKIEKQVSVFEQKGNENVGIVCSSVRRYQDGNQFHDFIMEKPSNLPLRIMIGNGIIFNSTVLTKRSLMLEIGGFDTSLKQGIDSDYFRNCIVKMRKDVFFMREVTTGVHEYGERITPTESLKALKKNISEVENSFSKYHEYLIENYKDRRSLKNYLLTRYVKLCLKEPNIKNFQRSLKGVKL